MNRRDLREALYDLATRRLSERRWDEAVKSFEELLSKDPNYQDAPDKFKEAKFRQRWAPILDPLDSIRPHWLNLWQFIGVILGTGVILAATVLCLVTGVGRVILLGTEATSTPTEVAVATTAVRTTQTLPPSLSPTVIQSTSPAPNPTATFTSEPIVTPTPETTPLPSETPAPEPSPTPSPLPAPPPPPEPKPKPLPLSGQIAFPVHDTKRQTYDIYLANVDGSNRRKLVEEASEPAISPDGSKIAFRSWNASTLGLMVANIDGTKLQRVSLGIEDACPYWAFGESLILHSTKEGPAPRLYTAGTWKGADGANNVQDVKWGMDPVHGQYPAWVPGGRIVYKYFERSGDFRGLYVMNSDGSNSTPITDHTEDTMPSVPPRGDKVAFMSKRTGKWEVYVVNIDGIGLRQLTHSRGYNSGLPTWSPDGNHIAFVSDRDNQWAIWVISHDGSGERKLFDLGGPLPWWERISWGP